MLRFIQFLGFHGEANNRTRAMRQGTHRLNTAEVGGAFATALKPLVSLLMQSACLVGVLVVGPVRRS